MVIICVFFPLAEDRFFSQNPIQGFPRDLGLGAVTRDGIGLRRKVSLSQVEFPLEPNSSKCKVTSKHFDIRNCEDLGTTHAALLLGVIRERKMGARRQNSQVFLL